MSRTPCIAIVGSGFSGTMLAFHLAMKARTKLSISLFDKDGAFAEGMAYSTRQPGHLLNVMTERMGAFDNKPEDFFRWLKALEKRWRTAHPELARWLLMPENYAPRLLFADYLKWLLQEAQEQEEFVTLRTICAEVIDADVMQEGITLEFSDREKQAATHLVLAMGNLPARTPALAGDVGQSGRYIGNIWASEPNSVLTRTRFSASDAPVVIIGTGLTMVDAVITLRARGYPGKIVAVSRHGLLPQPHKPKGIGYPRFLPPANAPHTALGLVHAIRREIKKAGQTGKDWRTVVDALRADTWALWTQLSEAEKKKLLRVLPYWNTHRHRMAPEPAALIEEQLKSGMLRIIAGHVRHISGDKERLKLGLKGPDGTSSEMEAGHVLNCAGPENNLAHTNNPLLIRLRDKGVISAGPLSWGIAADSQGHVSGDSSGRVFTLGPLLVGERFESVAVPELRKQAEGLALHLLAGVTA